jgi:hypothetical protein
MINTAATSNNIIETTPRDETTHPEVLKDHMCDLEESNILRDLLEHTATVKYGSA